MSINTYNKSVYNMILLHHIQDTLLTKTDRTENVNSGKQFWSFKKDIIIVKKLNT
jgi:hypothetical protein